jgi:PAS domain-containing protein
LIDLLGTLDEPAHVQAALKELRRGEAVDLEAWCWRAADGPAAVCLVAAPLELNDPRAVAYCLVRDITDQRLAAEEYARALSLHQATLNSTADGLLVVDPGGRVLSFNERFLDPPRYRGLRPRCRLAGDCTPSVGGRARFPAPRRGAKGRPRCVGLRRDPPAGWPDD